MNMITYPCRNLIYDTLTPLMEYSHTVIATPRIFFSIINDIHDQSQLSHGCIALGIFEKVDWDNRKTWLNSIIKSGMLPL